MRTKIVGAALLMVGATATPALALNNLALKGSDTLEAITKDVLDGIPGFPECPGAKSNGITYVGTGSTAGGGAMVTGNQNVSPQSRFLSTAEGCTSPATSEGLVIGLDGLSMVMKTSTANACGNGLAFSTTKSITVTDDAGNPVVGCTGCDSGTNTYKLANWREVIALIYGGRLHTTPATSDCNGPVRKSLVKNFSSLFENGCASGTCTAGLKRAYRRSDLSGTTDTFVSLVGIGSIPLAKAVDPNGARQNPFCNAFGAGNIFGGDSDFLDNDPIRAACETNEQACGRDGTLGLVTVVNIPATTPSVSQADLFPTIDCDIGAFRLIAPTPPGPPPPFPCPNGKPGYFGKCFQPVKVDASLPGGFTAQCIARRSPVQAVGGGGMDGRAYNLAVKAANGRYLKDNFGPTASTNRFLTAAFFRLHTTRTIAAGANTCQQQDETRQIGCLTQANPCSIGFSGREASTANPGVTGLTVNGLEPSIPNIEALVTTASTADDYVLARKLYFNTIKGFQDPILADGELALAKCFGQGARMAAITAKNGFVPVPGGIICQDFNGASCATNPSSADACSDNPADLITP